MPGRTLYFLPRSRPLPPPKPAPPPPEPVYVEPFDWSRVTPRSSYLLVELSAAPETSPGGIILPQRWQQSATDARVLASGPGRVWIEPNGERTQSLVWAEPGDLVVFQQHHFIALSADKRTGIVRDDNLVGWVDLDRDTLEPLNNWVRVRQDAVSLQAGAIQLTEEWAPKPMSGTVEAIGPGRLLLTGPLTGRRVPIPQLWGVGASEWMDLRVHWGGGCEVLAVGRDEMEFCFLDAGDLELIQ